MSTPEPGPSGSTNFTVRCGQVCAADGGASSMSGASRPKASNERCTLRMGSSDLAFENQRDSSARSCTGNQGENQCAAPVCIEHTATSSPVDAQFASTLMLAALMIGHHLSISALW